MHHSDLVVLFNYANYQFQKNVFKTPISNSGLYISAPNSKLILLLVTSSEGTKKFNRGPTQCPRSFWSLSVPEK